MAQEKRDTTALAGLAVGSYTVRFTVSPWCDHASLEQATGESAASDYRLNAEMIKSHRRTDHILSKDRSSVILGS